MPKMTPYEIGRKREYEAMRIMESWYGCRCVRSARSGTPIDFIAGNGIQVFAVQVKYGIRPKKVDWDTLREWAQDFQALPTVLEKVRGGRWKLYIDEEQVAREGTQDFRTTTS